MLRQLAKSSWGNGRGERKFNWSVVYNQRNLYIFGFLLAFVVTFLEVMRGRHMNFIVFADATRDFWQGIHPYTEEFVASHGRFFLYSPTFTVLFAPFAYLPAWLGPFVWNLSNYTLFFVSVFTLPKWFTYQQKCRIFLFLLPILGQSLLSFQYNVAVTYLFLFAYTLLEKKQHFWAILLIMISACTKIYGVFELVILLCYPRLWRNLSYAVVIGGLLLAMPLLKLAPGEFFPYYGEWFQSLSTHQAFATYESLYFAEPFSNWLLPHFRALQIGTLLLLALLFFANYRKWELPAFRLQALSILMGWVVLLSDSAEKHTYIIALAGFILWYWSRSERTIIDRILFWSCFFLLCIVPIDIIVPVPVMQFITRTLWLHVWVFFIVWIRMISLTFLSPHKQMIESPIKNKKE